MTEADIILALEQRWATRDELKVMLGCSDRAARAYIEELNERLMAYGKCVVSTSSRAGYHIPSPYNQQDLEIVAQAIEELKSRAISVFERRKVLENFIKNSVSLKETEKEVQLSLF